MALNLQTQPARDMEALAARLSHWLASRPHLRDLRPVLKNLRYVEGAGSANETMLAELLCAAGPSPAAERVVVRLLGQEIRIFLDNDLRRQLRVIEWVARNTRVPVPHVIDADPDGELLAQPFVIMAHINGKPAADFPSYNEAGFLHAMEESQRRRLWNSAIDRLCELHRAPSAGLEFLDFAGAEGHGLTHLFNHWMASYRWAAEHVASPFFDQVSSWLQSNLPADTPAGLSWGDARMGNMLFDERGCVAVLDWEMASGGGPLVDLAWWLLFDRVHDEDIGVPRLPGLGSRQQTIERWQAGTGHSAAALHWHEVFATFQLSIMRSKTFGERRRLGKPVPTDDDPRSVLRLQRRLQRLLGT